MNDEKSTAQQVKDKGIELEAIHGVDNVAAVAYKGGGYAFFRAPSGEEHDSFSLYMTDDDASQETKTKTTRSYAKSCFVCTLSGETFDQVCEKAGVVWFKGPVMRALGKISGGKEAAPTVFSFR